MDQRLKRLFFVLAMVGTITSLAVPLTTQAQVSFDYNYVLSDNDLVDYNSMSVEQIQNFLLAKGSSLASYVDPITSLRVAKIIYTSAQDFHINPKFLLALMQKEQSLVENPSPTQYNYDWATGYAVCDGCDINDPSIQRFKGFYNQVYNAAKRIRQSYLPSLETTGKTITGLGVGYGKIIDGILVTPVNNATAVAYTYTPHLHGNQILWTIWNRYFTRAYPDGSVISEESSKDIWLLENSTRRKFINHSVFASRYGTPEAVVSVSRSELLKYPEGLPIKFANYSFLRSPRGTVYLLVDDTLHGFDSREALRRVGINPGEIINVKQEDLLDYRETDPITVKSVFPLGTLLSDKKTGGVFWVKDGYKHPIWSKEILKSNFPGRRATPLTAKELEAYPTSNPVPFRDGDLVKSKTDAAVYLISNKQRLPFASMETLLQLGFEPKRIVTTSDSALVVHELGQPITKAF